MLLALDIETKSNLDEMPHLRDYKFGKITPDRRLKDPIKIEADIKDKQRKIVEEAALSPTLGRIAAVTACDLAEGSEVECFANAESEDAVMDEFIPWWSNLPSSVKLVTWNGRAFDIPFLGFRLVANGLKPAVRWPRPRDWERVIDVMELVGRYASLNECLISAGIDPKIAEGSDVAGMDTMQLITYTVSEMVSFVKLVHRFRSVGMF